MCQAPQPCDHRPQLGGIVSPDGSVHICLTVDQIDWPKNIASRGLGCCGSRALDYAARWQGVPELVDLPEQIQRDGIAGGDNPFTIREKMARYAPSAPYWSDTSGDLAILTAACRSRRLPCIDYAGRDPHYAGSIAHCVCVVACEPAADWVAILDNNYPSLEEVVWMGVAEFEARWHGWSYGLLAATPGDLPQTFAKQGPGATIDSEGGPVFGLLEAGHPWGDDCRLNGERSTVAAILEAIGGEMAPVKIEVDHQTHPFELGIEPMTAALLGGGLCLFYFLTRKED